MDQCRTLPDDRVMVSVLRKVSQASALERSAIYMDSKRSDVAIRRYWPELLAAVVEFRARPQAFLNRLTRVYQVGLSFSSDRLGISLHSSLIIGHFF